MDLCPKCNRMTAERNHYTQELICYNRFCEQQASELKGVENKGYSFHKSSAISKKTVKDTSRSR